jgi:hypothetical protein
MDRRVRRQRATLNRPSMPGHRFIIALVPITTATTGPAITDQAIMGPALIGAGGHIGRGLRASRLVMITQAAFSASENEDREASRA